MIWSIVSNKTAMKFYDSYSTGLCGFLASLIKTKVMHFLALVYASAPHSALWIKGNSGKSRRVVSLFAFVTGIFRTGGFAQITKTVVVSDTVDVINLILRPLPGHVKPRQTMGVMIRAVNLDVKVTPSVKSSFAANPASIPSRRKSRTPAPNKNAALWIIIQNVTQKLRREWSCLHGYAHLSLGQPNTSSH